MKSLTLLTAIIASSLFLTACGKKDEVEVLPGITKDMMPAEIPSEMPPMTTTEEHERQKLEEYCANAAYFPSWDAEGKCDDLKKLKDPEK